MAKVNELLNDESMETGVENVSPTTVENQEAQDSQDSQESLQKEQLEKTVPLKALESEREKRQSYEKALAELQAQNRAFLELLQKQQQPISQQQQVRVPDFLTENDQWQQYLFNSIGQILDQREQRAWVDKVESAEEDMRDSTPDYDELVDKYFKPAASVDQTLALKLRQAANPAKFAYRTAKKLQAEAELGHDMDVNKLKAKIEAEVRAKVLAELEGKQAELQDRVKIPESLGSSGMSAPKLSDSMPVGGNWRARDLYGG